MIGNFHVRFLGGKGAVMPPTYPAKAIHQSISSDNPYVEIRYSEYIRIQ